MAGLLRNGIEIPALDWLIQFTFHGALIVGLLTGTALGLFNGLMITAFKVPPFVATLAMMSIARGLTKLWTGGEPITKLGPSMAFVGWGDFLGIPVVVWIPAALALLFILVSRKTRFGRHVYAVGGNETAALLSGLPVRRVKVTTYAFCGLLSAVAALILTARLDSATVVAGETFELNAIAAVVIGGTSLSGGRGTIMGTVLGCLIIGVLANGLVLLSVSPFWQQVIKGIVILLAIVVDKINAKA
jgi:ribose transport system permease protein